MVQPDRGDRGHGRFEDVRRIETASEPHFADGHVDPGAAEKLERNRRRRLEKSRRRLQLSARQEPFHGVTQVGSRRFERRPADRLAHDDEPLRQIDQMW